jgi:hypothetical protein
MRELRYHFANAFGFRGGCRMAAKAGYKIHSFCVVARLTAVSGMPVSKVTSLHIMLNRESKKAVGALVRLDERISGRHG